MKLFRVLLLLTLAAVSTTYGDNLILDSAVAHHSDGTPVIQGSTRVGTVDIVKVIISNSDGSNSGTAATFTQGIKAVTTAGTPVPLVPTQTLVESVEFHARKNVTTANTGNIYIGFSSTGGQNYRVLAPSDPWSITAPPGKKLDLHLVYIDAATSADAVTFTATN